MKREALYYINNKIERLAKNLSFTVSDAAPNSENELFSSTSLVVWSGASNNTIFQDASINWKLRALHDLNHLKTGLGFRPCEEIELGRLEASRFDGLFADLIYCEVAMQASYFEKNKEFICNQTEFSLEYLESLGYKL